MNCKSLTSLNTDIIKSSVFNDYSKLNYLNIPDSIDEICKFAFSNCKSIENVSIPNSVICIDINAFQVCNFIKKINIPTRFKERVLCILNDVDISKVNITFNK